MKRILFLSIFFAYNSFAQCTYCTDMTEALKAPERVEYLDLSSTALTSFPAEIGQFVNLLELNLSDNALLEIDFSQINLPFLEVLNLSNNPGFNAMALDHIGEALPQLTELHLSRCQIDVISPDLSTLHKLRSVDLSGNAIQELPQALEEMQSLHSLNVSNNKLGESEARLQHLWNVQWLDLSGNDKLSLQQVSISMDFKDSLQYMAVTPKYLDKSLPSDFRMINVNTLCLSGGSLEKINRAVTGNESIQKIVFKENSIVDYDEVINWINLFDGLKEVEFQGVDIPPAIEQIKGVDRLTLSGCKIALDVNFGNVDQGTEVVFMNCNREDLVEEEPEKIEQNDPWGMNQAMLENRVMPVTKSKPYISVADSQEDMVLEFPNTSFNIPANSFVNTQGQSYIGNVRIEVKEYFDAVTNALEGMPMSYSENNGDYLFSSSGMFDFRAFDEDGNPLTIAADSDADFAIRDAQSGADMNLYYFNDSTNNWDQSASDPTATNFDERRRLILDSLMEMDDAEFVFTRRVPAVIRMKYKRKKYDPSILDFEVSTSGIRKMTNVQNGRYFLNNKDQKYLAKHSWKLDTLMTDEMLEVFKDIKKCQRKADRRSRGIVSRYNYVTRPRLLMNLTITPDLDRDNYRMEFLFKGNKVSLPVYPEIKGGVSKVQSREKSNFNRYQATVKLADKEEQRIGKKERRYIESQADAMRERQANMLAASDGRTNGTQEQLLGPLRVGLGNLDHPITFFREPASFVVLDSVATDEEGREVELPMEVRNVWVDRNTYFTNNNRQVIWNTVGRIITFFVVSASEIFVVTDYDRKDGSVKAKVRRVNTEGMTTQQVRSLISNL